MEYKPCKRLYEDRAYQNRVEVKFFLTRLLHRDALFGPCELVKMKKKLNIGLILKNEF